MVLLVQTAVGRGWRLGRSVGNTTVGLEGRLFARGEDVAPGSRQGGRGTEMAQRSREQGLQSSLPGRGAGKEKQDMWEDKSRGGGKGQAMKDGTLLRGAGVRRRLE